MLIPYDLERLWLFVAMIAFVYLTTTTASSSSSNLPVLRDHLPVLLGMTLCTFVAYIIYGASPTRHFGHTLAAALHLMILVQWDPPLLLRQDDGDTGRRGRVVSSSSSLNVLERLSLAASPNDVTGRNDVAVVDRLAVMQTRAVVGATIVLHILRLYDRGWQAQRWPVPTVLGATGGWIAGRWMGLVMLPADDVSSEKGSL